MGDQQTAQETVIAVLILAALVYSRWLLFPDYLITFDEINFAFAIKEFNPASHQPQPPGYPLFVGLLRILAWIIPKVEIVFFCAAIVISAAALALMSKLGDLIAGERTGMIAALLLLFNPPFWLSALTNPVRLTSAMGASAVALCAWLATRDRSARWICVAAVAAGFAAGFRPMLGVHSLPLIVWAACIISIGPKLAALAVASYAAAVSLWFFPLMTSVGGIGRFLTLLATYSRDQIAPTSALFGASLGASATMASQAIVWSCVGVLSWFWAIVFVRPNCVTGSRLATQFLAVWFVPGLLGHSVLHVADPDHTLDIIPVTCLAGALLLNGAVRGMSARQRTGVIGVAVLLNVLLFLKPVSKAAHFFSAAVHVRRCGGDRRHERTQCGHPA